MEELWKDINLSSLNDPNKVRGGGGSGGGGVILQDFLTPPLHYSSNSSNNSSSSSIPTNSDQNNNNASFYCSVSSTQQQQQLVTALSLNSRPHHFHYDPIVTNNNHNHNVVQNMSKVSSFVNPSPFDQNVVGVVASNGGFTCFGKRLGEAPDISPCERRNNRMIKNRESAARSRARKQAYTNELEQKVELLQEENARLKRQQQELWEAVNGHQQKKKNSLYRTTTAPF